MLEKNARDNSSRNTRIVRAKNFVKKSSWKSANKRFLYSHEYRDHKMGGRECAKQFCQQHPNSASKNVWVKNRREKCEKTFLIFIRISWPKKGEKRAKQVFEKNKNSASKKCWEKIDGIIAKNGFFIFTRISCRKNGGKKRAKQFFQKHTNSANKKCCEKIEGKSAKKVFYIHTNIVTKK